MKPLALVAVKACAQNYASLDESLRCSFDVAMKTLEGMNGDADDVSDFFCEICIDNPPSTRTANFWLSNMTLMKIVIDKFSYEIYDDRITAGDPDDTLPLSAAPGDLRV